MGFAKLQTGGAAKPVTTPPPAAAVEKPAPVAVAVEATRVERAPEVETRAVTTDVRERALKLFAGAPMGNGVLAAITQQDVRSLSFPILQLGGGNSGGSFAPLKAVPEEVANQMPQGKKPFEGYILGYRTEMAGWPVGYEEREEGTPPAWSVAISSEDAAGSELVRKASKNYQFTKGTEKDKFDHASSGVGHVRPSLQLLVWLPDVEDLIVVSTPAHFISWQKTGDQLKRNADPRTGEVMQFPAQMRPVSTQKTINGFTITEHVIDISAMLNEAGMMMAKKFAAWREQAKTNDELVQKVGEWVQCADRPRTPDIDAILKKAASL